MAETSMIEPSIKELSEDGKFNKYTLVIASSKCARMVTDEYVKQREYVEKLIASKSADKSIVSLIKREYRDDKALKIALNRIIKGEFRITGPDGKVSTFDKKADATSSEQESK